MHIKILKGWLMLATLGLVAGCSTPMPPDLGCGVPGGLCAPLAPNTSVQPLAPPTVPNAPRSETTTAPVELYPGSAAAPAAQAGPVTARIALLLPLQSASLGQAAAALRAGFMVSHERDGAGLSIDLIDSGDTAASTLAAYARASAANDIVVGPLGRTSVGALIASAGATLSKPTLLLNQPHTEQALPAHALVIGLSLDDEARQVADWAAQEQPAGRALVLSGGAAWQQRAVGAFTARWAQRGLNQASVALPVHDGYIDANALSALRRRLEIDRPQLVFAALDAGQLRQVRSALGTTLPTYAVSAANPGRGVAVSVPELDGLRLLDLPWTLDPDNPQVMLYPRPVDLDSLDMQRLYALGIDAFCIARELARQPGTDFELDGVTGHLAVHATTAPWSLRRVGSAAVYHDGIGYEAVTLAK